MKLNIFVPFHTMARIEVQGEHLSAVHLDQVGSSKQRGKKTYLFQVPLEFQEEEKKKALIFQRT